MATKIYDTAACLRIEIGDAVRLLNKEDIRGVEIVNGRVCISTGQEQLQQLFINYPDVEVPAIGTAEMRSREDLRTAQLTTLVSTIEDLKLILNGTNDYFREPQIIENVDPFHIYKGYSNIINASTGRPFWAISETKISGTTTITHWAEGNKNFDKIWDDYLSYSY
jgi:hypothetical protein